MESPMNAYFPQKRTQLCNVSIGGCVHVHPKAFVSFIKIYNDAAERGVDDTLVKWIHAVCWSRCGF